MMKLMSLWKKEDKNGQQYLSGKLGDLTVMIFVNSKKTAENQPDYFMNLAEPLNKGFQQREVPQESRPQPPRNNAAYAPRRQDPPDEPNF